MKNVVVIGAGISGLSAALTCLIHDSENTNVTVVEKWNRPGGAVTSFKRDDYTFDTCQMMPDISDFIDFFKLNLKTDRINDIFGSLFVADAPNVKIDHFIFPSDFNEFLNRIIDFPDADKDRITAFFRKTSSIFENIRKLKIKMNMTDIINLIFNSPDIVRFRNYSFSEFINCHKMNGYPFVEIFNYFSAMTGLPPDNAAALLSIGIMHSIIEGAYAVKPVFSELPQQMAAKIIELGGKIKYKTEVKSFSVDTNRINGVILKNGQQIEADYVISAIDAKKTAEMIKNSCNRQVQKSKFVKKCSSMEMTGSSFTVYLGLDDRIDLNRKGLKGNYHILTSGKKSAQRIYSAFLDGKILFDDNNFQIAVSHTIQPNEPGPVLTLSIHPVPFEFWHTLRITDLSGYKKEKNMLALKIIAVFEKYLIPDLSSHIRMMCTASPATYSRYTGTASGSIHDIASLPDNFGASRISMFTPIEGLLMPKFSHGIYGTLCGGMQAADAVFNYSINKGKASLQKK
ncbi:MAG: NAD(P)/FAD-dependent oxidoreductase [Spirochaetes bacterium]|nr:NAD(P)/FAD-dependent oxidoreductase [Spirochaetota bacterium]